MDAKGWRGPLQQNDFEHNYWLPNELSYKRDNSNILYQLEYNSENSYIHLSYSTTWNTQGEFILYISTDGKNLSSIIEKVIIATHSNDLEDFRREIDQISKDNEIDLRYFNGIKLIKYSFRRSKQIIK